METQEDGMLPEMVAILLDAVAVAVVAVDGAGRVLYGNAEAGRLFGWPEGVTAAGHVRQLLDTSPPPGAATATITATGRRRDGSAFSALVTAATARLSAAPLTILTISGPDQRPFDDSVSRLSHEFAQGLHVIRLTAEALELGLGNRQDGQGNVVAKAGVILSQVDRLSDSLLRLREYRAGSVSEPRDAAAAGGARRRLLVVDDDGQARRAAAEMLQRRGCDVVVAGDSDEALRLCHAELFDLVLTDLHMPGVDGYGLVRELHRIQPGTPVIVVTGDAQARRHDLAPNTVAVLVKPLSLVALEP